jgi:predicted transcriptional regulator
VGRIRRKREHRHYNVQALHERHHQMLRLALIGHQTSEIAAILGVTPQNVSDVLSSPLAAEQLSVMKVAADTKAVDIARMLQEEAPKCLELLKQIREGQELSGERPTLKLRMEAAESLLDRQGTSKIQNIRGLIGHTLVTDEVLQEIKEKATAAKRAAQHDGNVIQMAEVLSA